MTNYEKFKEELKKILVKTIGININTGEILPCPCLPCNRCKFNNSINCKGRVKDWLDEEYIESEELIIDWERVPINTPIIIRNNAVVHFANYYNGFVHYFMDGRTSYTAATINSVHCSEVSLVQKEDFKKYAIKVDK